MVDWHCHYIEPTSSPQPFLILSLHRGVGVGYINISLPCLLLPCLFVQNSVGWCQSTSSHGPVAVSASAKFLDFLCEPTRQQLCPGESKLLFGLTGMTPKISFCSWPMPRNSKKPSGISTRFVPSCSIQYHWRDSSAHKTIEPFNLQRAAFKVYTSELKHSPMFWSKP